MDFNRIDSLLDRIKCMIHEGSASPEFIKFSQTADKLEDEAHELLKMTSKILEEGLDPKDVQGLPKAQYNEVDTVVVRIRNLIDTLLFILDQGEAVVRKHMSSKNSIETARIHKALEEYKQFLGQEIQRYQSPGARNEL